MIKSLCALLFCVLLFTSCDDGIRQGYVYDKHYSTAYYSESGGYYSSTCTGTGSRRSCRQVWHSGSRTYHWPSYTLYISSCKHNVQNSECKRGIISVSSGVYERYRIGDYYNG